MDTPKRGERVLIKPRLFTPGPTPLAPEVLSALGQPIPHHRSPEFRALLLECRRGLQAFLQTTSDVLLLGCSGSGAMEAGLVNVLSPGERLLALVAGRFGERWVEIARAHGIRARDPRGPLGRGSGTRASCGGPWCRSVPPSGLCAALRVVHGGSARCRGAWDACSATIQTRCSSSTRSQERVPCRF